MHIVIGSDHAGYRVKQELGRQLRRLRHRVDDVGTTNELPVDYPDFAARVALTVGGRRGRRGVFVTGSGVGATIAANMIPGVRAGLCHDVYSARQGVEQDRMNLLVMSAKVVGPALALDLVKAFVRARFLAEPRLQRCLEKVALLERHGGRRPGLLALPPAPTSPRQRRRGAAPVERAPGGRGQKGCSTDNTKE